MDFIQTVLTSLWFVFLLVAFFGVTIFVHELGHFLVARACGLVVETFAIGFGPPIWKRTINGVVYKIGIFPVGGYVALPQLDPSGMSRIQGTGPDGTGAPLPFIAPWKKILVSISGAVGNILLAIVLAWVVYLVGMPAGPAERSSVVGFVEPDSAAAAAGLVVGDTIQSVNELPVHKWSDLRMEAAFHQEVDLTVRKADGTTLTMHLPTTPGMLGEQHIPGIDGPDLCMVLKAAPGMAAAEAGMRTDDVIIGFDGKTVYSQRHLIQLVRDAENRTVDVVVKRLEHGEERELTFALTPVRDPKMDMVRIGVEFNVAAVERGTVIRPRPMEQLRSHASAIFRFLEALGTPKQAKAATQAVGGPVAILVSYWYIVKSSPMLAIWFTGFLNVNLAILNLLPIPVLDGGHICFALYEMIRRKPLPARFVNALVNVFAVLLISLILLISARDVDRFTPVGSMVRNLFGKDKPAATTPALHAAPPAPTNAPANE